MNVLVIQTAFLGDVVMTTPLLRELKRAAPGGRVTVVATPMGAAALQGSAFVDSVIPFDKKGADRGPLASLRLTRRLRRERFDVAVAAQRSFRTGVLLRGSGAPTRIGFEGAPGAWAYTHRVPWDATVHAVRRYLALAGPAGASPDADPRPEMTLLPEARGRATTLLRDVGVADDVQILAVAPGSQWGTKRWNPDGFAAVIRSASAKGLVSVLLGGEAERELCESIAGLSGRQPVVLAGRTSIAELAALLARSRLLLTGDSGPAHVASAVGTPVVAIFGPTVPGMGYTPYGEATRIVEHPGLPCRPCSAHGPQTCPLGHHKCMLEIAPDRVAAVVAEVARTRGAVGDQRVPG